MNGSHKSARSKKRETLNPDLIVTAALAVVAKYGLAEFSTRKLAAALGCEAMSIYHYFPSKQHLLDGMVDRTISEIELPPPGLPFREALRVMLYSMRETGRRHAAFFPYLSVHRLNTRAGLTFLDRAMGLFRQTGISDFEAAQSFRIVSYFIVGAVLDEAVGYAKGPSAAEPVPGDEVASSFPNITAAGPYFKQQYWDSHFDRGVNILLDRLEADMERAKRTGA